MTDAVRFRRSDAARARILDSARAIFATHGYEKTTVRAIAARSEVNVALVIRYFGSKDALFAEVATLDLRTEALAGVPLDRLGRALVAHVLDLWEDDTNGAALAAMVRASISHEPARERIVAQFSAQVGRLFSTWGSVMAGAAPFIATQIIGMTMTRFIWRIPFVAAVPRAVLVERLGGLVQRIIDEAPRPSAPFDQENARP